MLDLVQSISSIILQIPKDLRTPDACARVGANLEEVHRRLPKGIPLLDPIEDMQIADTEFKSALKVLLCGACHVGISLAKVVVKSASFPVHRKLSLWKPNWGPPGSVRRLSLSETTNRTVRRWISNSAANFFRSICATRKSLSCVTI